MTPFLTVTISREQHDMVRIKPQLTKTARVRRHLLNVLAIALTLELCSRAFVPEQFEMVVRDLEVGRTLVKNLDRDFYNNESRRLIRVKTNSLGFRGADPEVPKPAGVRRVVVLGDSFISALQVEADESMCSQLEDLLNESSRDVRWEVLNFGVTGSGTADQHVRYLETIRNLEPDIVLVGFGMGTDPVDNNPKLSNSPLVHYDFDETGELKMIPDSAVSANTANVLNRSSRLYIWQKGITNRIIKSIRNRAGWFDKRDRIYLEPAPEEIEYSWRLTEAILERFHADVSYDGVEFHVVTIPSSREIYRDLIEDLEGEGRAAGLTREFNQNLPLERITGICQRQEIPFIALEPGFRAHAPELNSKLDDQRLFFNGHGHMNVKGNRVAAELIAAQLLKSDRSRSAPPQIADEIERLELR